MLYKIKVENKNLTILILLCYSNCPIVRIKKGKLRRMKFLKKNHSNGRAITVGILTVFLDSKLNLALEIIKK